MPKFDELSAKIREAWVEASKFAYLVGHSEAENQAVIREIIKTGQRPKVVCLCGSTRFFDAFSEANLKETRAGNIVLSVGCHTHSDSDLGISQDSEEKKKLDELHLRKIDLADEVLILNVGGYIGESTRRELEYATKKGRTVRYLEAQNV